MKIDHGYGGQKNEIQRLDTPIAIRVGSIGLNIVYGYHSTMKYR